MNVAGAVDVLGVQLALNVTDHESATRFYSLLFGVEPHKQRPGYTNFAITEPPLKLVLFENPGAPSALNHLGVELADADEVIDTTSRFNQLGLQTRTSEQEMCCNAVQDAVYVTAPEVPARPVGVLHRARRRPRRQHRRCLRHLLPHHRADWRRPMLRVTACAL